MTCFVEGCPRPALWSAWYGVAICWDHEGMLRQHRGDIGTFHPVGSDPEVCDCRQCEADSTREMLREMIADLNEAGESDRAFVGLLHLQLAELPQ